MDYSPGIQFQTILINMDESKSLTTSNQPENKQQKRCQCGSIKDSPVTSKDCSVGLAIRRAKKLDLGMAISKSEAKKAEEDASAEEEKKCLAAEDAGEGENQMRGNQKEIWYKIQMLRQ